MKTLIGKLSGLLLALLVIAGMGGYSLLRIIPGPASAQYVQPQPLSAAPGSPVVVPPLIITAVHIPPGERSPQAALPADAAALAVFSPNAPRSDFVITYQGPWDPAAQAAFEYAANIWESWLVSPVPVQVEAVWEDLTALYGNPYILGGASANDYWKNFSGGAIADTWYPSSLANSLAGYDLQPVKTDIHAAFNSSFPSWYFGLDGQPASNQYDFLSVALHELGHGLGFSGSMSVTSTGSWGYGSGMPFIYDRFIINGVGQSLLNVSLFPNNSVELANQLQSGDLFFSGTAAIAANDGQLPRIYSPRPWQQGSSFSHLDEATYPISSGKALMTPQLANGESVHAAGALTLSILGDLGWVLNDIGQVPTPEPHDPPTDWLFLPFTQR